MLKSAAKCAIATCLILSSALPAAFAGDYRQSDVDAALKGLTSEDQYERKSAAFKLTEMGKAAASATPVLVKIVQSDPSMQVRGEASHALGNIGPDAEAAVPALIGFLRSPEGGYERTYAASALGDIGRKPELAVPVLIELVQSDPEPVVRQLAARALAGFGGSGSAAIPVLVDAIKTGDKDMREAACAGLKSIPARAEDLPLLAPLLNDEIDSARTAATRSVAALGSNAAPVVPQLIKLLDDSNSDVKSSAIEALAAIGSGAREAIPSLKKQENDPLYRDQVRDALKRIRISG